MSDYKQKYLKYKNKYLELKQSVQLKRVQKGGIGPFYVYTTGIAYTVGDSVPNNKTGDPELVNFWVQRFRARILELLPEYVDQIHFIHHDILLNEVDYTLPTDAQKQVITQRFNDLLQMSDMTSDDRVRSSVFTSEPLNFAEVESRPSLVIDFAHIFSYAEHDVKTVYADSHRYSISSIYLGFLGENYLNDGFRTWNLLNIPMFSVQPNYEVETYIDKFVRLGYAFNNRNPQDFFNNKITEFRSQMELRWRALHAGSIAGCDEVFRAEHNVTQFFNYLIQLIFEVGVEEVSLVGLMMENFENLLH